VRRDLPRPGPAEEYPLHELAEQQLEPALAVTGLLTDGQIEIRSVLAIEAVTLPSGDGEERLELIDKDGRMRDCESWSSPRSDSRASDRTR
jgi:hypothetical protein